MFGVEMRQNGFVKAYAAHIDCLKGQFWMKNGNGDWKIEKGR